jgi:predicted enzyme related to lactoylglutathione lyase
MAIKSMKLGWIVVSDMKKTKKFFTETLGLNTTNESPEHNWMELQGKEGGFYLGVGQFDAEDACADKNDECNDDAVGMNAVMTMTVDDLVKTKAELEAKGVQFIDEIMEIPGHVKMVTFVDPDNNMFQLVEELDNHSK